MSVEAHPIVAAAGRSTERTSARLVMAMLAKCKLISLLILLQTGASSLVLVLLKFLNQNFIYEAKALMHRWLLVGGACMSP
ncbi:hypothetical protein HanPI659440_Chr12g0475181 [Helianthus annuus]|nr:hypothetical protein HanPI659440_Chr12g0475181 [Helianthus annuus]